MDKQSISNKVRKRILIPLVVVFFFLTGFFIYQAYISDIEETRGTLQHKIKGSDRLLNDRIAEDSVLLNSVIDSVARKI